MRLSGHSLPAAEAVLPSAVAMQDTIISFLFSVKLET
jgi:hypothetical protein